jgi:tRNA(fMet)-specific endonuclease VapC
MAMIVADTDVLIDFLAGVGAGAYRVELELQRGTLWTTAVSRFELLSGTRTKRQQTVIRDLLAALPTLPLDETAADRAAEVRRELEAKGAAIGMADSLVAGIVLDRDGILLTRNRQHFERVPGLALATLA